jgi:transcriptional regulator with XRE-family HTH domain
VAEGESRNAIFGEGVSFGGQLRRLRETTGLTQEELASRAGLTMIATKTTAYTYAFFDNRLLGRPQGRIKEL